MLTSVEFSLVRCSLRISHGLWNQKVAVSIAIKIRNIQTEDSIKTIKFVFWNTSTLLSIQSQKYISHLWIINYSCKHSFFFSISNRKPYMLSTLVFVIAREVHQLREEGSKKYQPFYYYTNFAYM
ncbi:unnamed protein product [Phytomonas sp. Hart1]|nr:unnamed protein product [Phytomonas sp. Hart1]|eukprot:CCW67412.1 unnamed protein product [Phytomonas sp. isolate Hart1]